MLVFITNLCVITQIGNKHQHRRQTCPFPWCFSPMLSGTTSSRFCVSSRSVRASRPFSSDGSSSRRFSDTSRHTNLRRFPSSYTHKHINYHLQWAIETQYNPANTKRRKLLVGVNSAWKQQFGTSWKSGHLNKQTKKQKSCTYWW